MNYSNKRLTILFIIVSLIILACAFFVGCSSDNEVNADENRMVIISKEQFGCIVYDRKTKVEYWSSANTALTLLVDENGNPLIYKGE